MYTNILFDFDGTVFDTVEGISKSVKYSANKYGLDAPLEELNCFAGPPLKEMFIQKFGVDDELATRLVAGFRERYIPIGIHESRPFPGIDEVLKDVKTSGKKLAITTLKPQFMAEELLTEVKLEGLFDVIRGTDPYDNYSLTKTDVIRSAMEALGATAENTLLVGDRKYDIWGAHEAGIKAVGVRYGYSDEGELEKAGADFIVNDLKELKELLLILIFNKKKTNED